MFKHHRINIHSGGAVAALAVGAAVTALAVTGCSRLPGVYVYEGAATAAKAPGAFRATSYVDGIWSSKVLPTVRDKAVPAATLLPAIAANPTAAGKQYGHQASDGTFAYLVKGTGTVVKVDTAAATGPVTVDVDAGGGQRQLMIDTGPVFAGTALRDALGFITFGQFTNQVDYADVAQALNDKVRTDVVAAVDRSHLVGKRVTFAGALSALSPSLVSVVPTQLTVTP